VVAQPLEGMTRSRLAQVQPLGRPYDTAIMQDGLEDQQEIEIDRLQVHLATDKGAYSFRAWLRAINAFAGL
jgi:hypothetical protein